MKNMAYFMMLLSYLMLTSSDNWFILWTALEINMLSFIFIIYDGSNLSLNSMIKYFIIQVFSSLLFIIFLIFYKNNIYMIMFSNLVPLSMLFKLGVPPFHFWLVDVGESLSWINFLIFMTVQKLMPLFVLSILKVDFIMIFSIFLSCMSFLMMLYQNSLRKFFIYSSFLHLSWILYSMMNLNYLWIVYMFMYTMSFFFFKFLVKFYMNTSLQLLFTSFQVKALILLFMLNFTGVPPFIMFISKLIVIKMSLYFNYMLVTLMISSIINCFIYIYFVSSIFLYKNFIFTSKNMMSNLFYMNLVFIIFISFLYFI